MLKYKIDGELVEISELKTADISVDDSDLYINMEENDPHRYNLNISVGWCDDVISLKHWENLKFIQAKRKIEQLLDFLEVKYELVDYKFEVDNEGC